METLEQKKRRLYGRQYMDKYLAILNKLEIGKESKPEILSIVETDEIINRSRSLKLTFSGKISFSNKAELKNIVFDKAKNGDKEYYLFTSLSKECGVSKIRSLDNFNFDFEFNDDPSGIISLVDSSIEEKVLLDFYEDNEDKYIDIEYYD